VKTYKSLWRSGFFLPLFLMPAGAQTPAQPSDSSATVRVETRRVVEDVTVVDSHGKPIQDLTQIDFRILEDGAEQQIVSFEEHRPPVSPSASPLPPLPANTFSNLSDLQASGPLNVILYDLLSTATEYQPYAHNQLIAFLKERPPGQYAIFVLANHLVMLQGFTTNRQALIAAANGSGTRNQPGYLDAPDKDNHDASGKLGATLDPRDTDGAKAVETLAQMENDERDFRQDMQVEITQDAFTAIAKFLMPLPGRKNLLWLSGSFPSAVLPDSSDADAFRSQRNYGEGQKKVADLLNLSHTAVYAIDVRGLMSNPAFSASSRINLQRSGGADPKNSAGSANPAARAQQRFAASQAAEHDTLTTIASETGGHAFFNTNGLKDAFAKAVEEGSDYYTLTYDPGNKKFDGRMRKIRVELGRRGYELSYRRSYFADDLASVAHAVDSLGAALALGTPQIAELPFLTHLTAGQPAPATPEQLISLAKIQGVREVKPTDVERYAVDFAVPPSHVTLTPVENGGQSLKMEFAAYGYGPGGQMLNGERMQLKRILTPEMLASFKKTGCRYRLLIDLPVAARYLRVGALDNSTNQLGVVELPLPLAAQSGAQ